MEGKKLLHSIQLKNLLSYGSEGISLDLEPLNVLIGPNASGKSNLIEAISLLAAAPRDLHKPIREGGGTEEWVWKGTKELPVARLEIELVFNKLMYRLGFTSIGYRFHLIEEFIGRYFEEDEGYRRIYSLRGSRPMLKTDKGLMSLARKIDNEMSILSQWKDPVGTPDLTYIGEQFARIAFFRDWNLGRRTAIRRSQAVDLPGDFLLEDASNLGLVLNDLQNRRETKKLLVEKLQLFYEGLEDVTTKVQGGSIEIFFHEKGLERPVPAVRLSDGTLHYLCLLTILLHPEPPPLICIEEPELGLHPDIIPKIAELLVDASRRTQLIVTTHSETLVSALSDTPEAVVVCEKDDRGTQLRRLGDRDQLRNWLDRYMLGELWRMGEIGGNRW